MLLSRIVGCLTALDHDLKPSLKERWVTVWNTTGGEAHRFVKHDCIKDDTTWAQEHCTTAAFGFYFSFLFFSFFNPRLFTKALKCLDICCCFHFDQFLHQDRCSPHEHLLELLKPRKASVQTICVIFIEASFQSENLERQRSVSVLCCSLAFLVMLED